MLNWGYKREGRPDMNETFTCTTCNTTASALEQFPGGVCLQCWAASPEGQRMPTAEELTAMWKGGF
jgi:hypothetical protein